MSQSPTLLPGATIGIFGGGQLGRLTAMAARTMGYRIHVLDPDPGCPARFVVDQCVEAGWDDAREAARLARGCDVVTLEIEQISLASMNAAGSFAPVRPSELMLGIIQDRIEQKNWLARNGFPVGPFRAVRSLDELRDAITALGGRCFCKSATGGYDGRGQGKVGFNNNARHSDPQRSEGSESPYLSLSDQESGCPTSLRDVGDAANGAVIPSEREARVEGPPHLPSHESPRSVPHSSRSDMGSVPPHQSACHSERSEESPHLPLSLFEQELRGAWEALGQCPGIVEQAIDLDREISVLVARSPRGEVQVYPPAWNHHENQILAWSVIPAPLPDALAKEARELASSIADTFSLEGILAVELFVTKDGRLLVNELAPRPHNSYHASERACVTSQFEQLVRAVCNLPLGSPDVVQPCAIANLLGEVWLQPAEPSLIEPEQSGCPTSRRDVGNVITGAGCPTTCPERGEAESNGSPRDVGDATNDAVIPSGAGRKSGEVEGPPHLSLPYPTSHRDVAGVAAGFSPRLSTSLTEGALAQGTSLPSAANMGTPKPTPRAPHFDRALAVPGVRLHLYEKLRPRKGRKMGHLSAVAATPEEAVELVLRAKSLL